METKTLPTLDLATTKEIAEELLRRRVSFILIAKNNEANADRCLNAQLTNPEDRGWMITALINMLKKVNGREFVEEAPRE